MEKEWQESIEKLRKEKQQLQDRVRKQEVEIEALREQVRRLEGDESKNSDPNITLETPTVTSERTALSAAQIERYSRQLLLNDGFGVEGQRKLLSSSVLVIGAGGIGSTGVYICDL